MPKRNNNLQEGIFAITLFVENLDASKVFYQKVFSLVIIYEDTNSVVFEFGTTFINLLKINKAAELIKPAIVADSNNSNRIVMTVQVDDVDLMYQHLNSHQVKILHSPMDRSWGIRTATFQDPDGYIWEIAK